MTVQVNGRAVELPDGSPLAAVVERVTSAPSGVAVAVNDEVVPRASWADTPIADGDRIEIVTAKQGG
jgi:sulfur carrier protein